MEDIGRAEMRVRIMEKKRVCVRECTQNRAEGDKQERHKDEDDETDKAFESPNGDLSFVT